MVRKVVVLHLVATIIKRPRLGMCPGARMMGRSSTTKAMRRRTSLTSIVPMAQFLCRLAQLRGRMDLVVRGGLVAEDAAAAVVGRDRDRVLALLRAGVIGRVS